MLRVFGIAIFLAAALLFLVQPMAGKVLLPVLGGGPSVWNTCMVFFQAMLLLGYVYAHLLTRLAVRWQVGVHGLLMLAAAVMLPAAIDVTGPGESDPRAWVLMTLATMIGLPFFVVSASGPLLQRWFSLTGHVRGGDPYFLYAASNAGSLIGLLAYPFLVEPGLTRSAQSWLWALGFWALIPAVLLCARGLLQDEESRPPERGAPETQAPTVSRRRRFLWIALAAVPSSLMLGVTQHISTDIAAAPLLWVVPLGLYLVTLSWRSRGAPGAPGCGGGLFPGWSRRWRWHCWRGGVNPPRSCWGCTSARSSPPRSCATGASRKTAPGRRA